MSAAEPITYGYARASSDDRELDLQLEALLRAGVDRERIYTDEANSANSAERPGLKAVLRKLRDGTKLVTWKIDRLGRNLSELIQTADQVREKGADLVSLTEGIDTSNATGRAMAQMIELLAQLERDMVVERTRAGIAAARERGKHPGRRSPLTVDKRSEIVSHMLTGLSFQQIAPLVGLSKSTLYNHADDLRSEMAVVDAKDMLSS